MTVHRQEIIRLARSEGQIARPLLSRVLGISLPTITNLVKRLIRDEILIEEGFGKSRGGRRAALLKLNPAYAYAAGVEVSLSGIKAVLMDLSGGIVAAAKGKSSVVTDCEHMMDEVISAIDPILSRVPRSRLKGIGVGVAGLVDRENGVSIKFPHCENWSNVRIGNLLESRFKVETWVDNDVQAATLAEFRYGAARGVDSFLYLHVGHGIRVGMVVDGKVFHGVHGRAGELGHVVVEENGPICYCGNYGCLESLASPRAIVNQAREAIGKGVESMITSLAGDDLSAIDIDAVFSAARERDRLALNLIERAGTHIGRVVANLANLFDPSLFILGGRLADEESPMVEVIEHVFRRTAMPAARDLVKIRKSAFPESPCARGAATLVFDRMFEQMAVE
ncbi:MAG TPA: ROK family protein [Planctomycetota bacterium]|nr:ROK family protein [Planctomycetota bacterium]